MEHSVEESFGPYRAVRKLGEGGASVVFEGRREGGDFERRVAIKLMLDGAASAMPARETRILAALEHPNIARFLDAGATRTGLRYLVMEFVDGVPCTTYARDRQLDETARLRLFLDVCEAVRFANQSLVIHCDIKPANVLVSQTGEVKLLDFGISRLLAGGPAADHHTRLRYYSPDYASPEQILGDPLTVATDVYALGALLCELIGGRPPRSLAGLPLDEKVRLAAAGPSNLPLTGDLAETARKALQPDPARRYATVGDLAADVGRYLAGEPVEARPPSAVYRFGKFLRRHRLAVAAVALFAVALGTTAGVALRQRRLAAGRFDQIRGLANAVLFDVDSELAKLPGALGARHLLADRGVAYLDALAAAAPEDDEIQLEAARGFLRLADIEGVGNEPSLGASGRALPRLERADQLVSAVLRRSPTNRAAHRQRYRTLEALAVIYELRADARAVPTAEELVRLADRNLATDPADRAMQEERAHAIVTRALAYRSSREHAARAVEAWRDSVNGWKTLYDAVPGSLLRKRELARAYQFLAGAESISGQREQALQTIRIAYRMHQELSRVPGEEVDHMLAADMGLQANLTAQMRRYAEAIPLFEEQLRLREKNLAKDPNDAYAAMGVAGTMDRIGYAWVLLNKPEKGIPILEQSLARQRVQYARDPENILINREMLYVLSDLTTA